MLSIRKYHKWLMILVGVQFLIWSISGAYMVYMNIHYIHGDSLVNNKQSNLSETKIHITLADLSQRYGDINKLALYQLNDLPVYSFNVHDKAYLVDATKGENLLPLSEARAISIANYQYSGQGTVTDVSLITRNPPFELAPRHLPVWQVNFDDFGSPTLYISALSGTVVTKRHDFWRIFDWMFRFHLMDYQKGEVDNVLLFWISLLSLFGTLTGAFLAYQKLFKNRETSKHNNHQHLGDLS